MIVVGAGIVGLACAWRLAQEGMPVTVFEAQASAGEASWAGAGMLAPGGEFEEDTPAARMAMRSLALYAGFVEELRDFTGFEIEYRQSGALEAAFTAEEAAALTSKAGRQAGFGIRSSAAEHAGALAARFYPEDALVNPRDVTSALRFACVMCGVAIREYERVLGVLEEEPGVRTAAGEYVDDGVLVAAGPWSSDLLPPGLVEAAPGLRTKPVRGHLVAFDGVPRRETEPVLEPLLRHHNTYVLRRASGRLVVGSSTEHVGFEREVDEKVVEDICARAARLMPALAGKKPVDRWNGFRPAIAAGEPAIGRIEGTSIWTAFGHYRNGILLAPETARLIALSAA